MNGYHQDTSGYGLTNRSQITLKKKQNNIVFYNWFYHFSATSKHIAVKENTQGMSLTKQHVHSGVVFCQGDLNMTVLLIEKILFSENVMISCWIRSPSKGFSQNMFSRSKTLAQFTPIISSRHVYVYQCSECSHHDIRIPFKQSNHTRNYNPY